MGAVSGSAREKEGTRSAREERSVARGGERARAGHVGRVVAAVARAVAVWPRARSVCRFDVQVE